LVLTERARKPAKRSDTQVFFAIARLLSDKKKFCQPSTFAENRLSARLPEITGFCNRENLCEVFPGSPSPE
jgi:hypothetical protein